MKEFFDFLDSYLDFSDAEKYISDNLSDEDSLINDVEFLSDTFDINSINKFNIVLLGVKEDRSSANKDCSLAPDLIREHLFNLSKPHINIKLLDLGNLKKGKSVTDTYFAMQDVLRELFLHNITVIILGGSQDLTYAQYMAYKDIKSAVNIGSIDSRFDFGDSDSELSSDNYLSKIVIENGSHLFNYSNLAYQTYLVPFRHIKLMDDLYFDSIRLGDLQSDIEDSEFYLRDCNLVSFDISAIRQSDAPGCLHISPNGLFGNEACQLARYSGISESVSSFGLYEVNPKFDNRNQTISLSAQIIWYFIDGFINRHGEQPDLNLGEFEKHSVKIMDHIINFVHSLKTDRWWIEVPYPGENEDVIKVVSCSLLEYKLALKGEIPDRWWKTYQKIS